VASYVQFLDGLHTIIGNCSKNRQIGALRSMFPGKYVNEFSQLQNITKAYILHIE